jgi:hypothetical protein
MVVVATTLLALLPTQFAVAQTPDTAAGFKYSAIFLVPLGLLLLGGLLARTLSRPIPSRKQRQTSPR